MKKITGKINSVHSKFGVLLWTGKEKSLSIPLAEYQASSPIFPKKGQIVDFTCDAEGVPTRRNSDGEVTWRGEYRQAVNFKVVSVKGDGLELEDDEEDYEGSGSSHPLDPEL